MTGDRRPLFVRAASTPGGLSAHGLDTLARLTKAYGSRGAALAAVTRYGSTRSAMLAAGLDPR